MLLAEQHFRSKKTILAEVEYRVPLLMNALQLILINVNTESNDPVSG